MKHLEKTILTYLSKRSNFDPIEEFCVKCYDTGVDESEADLFLKKLSEDLARYIRHAKPRPKSKKSRVRKFEKDD